MSLCRAHHLGIDNVYFNCNRAADFAMADGLTKLGIENVPAVATRGVVLFHTSWLRLLGKDNGRFGSVGPGLGIDGADNPSVEVIPFEQGTGAFEVHQILLAQNGIHILESINTAELVEDHGWEFLFMLGPARITGAVQAIVNPIAIR